MLQKCGCQLMRWHCFAKCKVDIAPTPNMQQRVQECGHAAHRTMCDGKLRKVPADGFVLTGRFNVKAKEALRVRRESAFVASSDGVEPRMQSDLRKLSISRRKARVTACAWRSRPTHGMIGRRCTTIPHTVPDERCIVVICTSKPIQRTQNRDAYRCTAIICPGRGL